MSEISEKGKRLNACYMLNLFIQSNSLSMGFYYTTAVHSHTAN